MIVAIGHPSSMVVLQGSYVRLGCGSDSASVGLWRQVCAVYLGIQWRVFMEKTKVSYTFLPVEKMFHSVFGLFFQEIIFEK